MHRWQPHRSSRCNISAQNVINRHKGGSEGWRSVSKSIFQEKKKEKEKSRQCFTTENVEKMLVSRNYVISACTDRLLKPKQLHLVKVQRKEVN